MKRLSLILLFIQTYISARWCTYHLSKKKIHKLQQRKLKRLQNFLSKHSPYFHSWANQPWSQWPMMDKTLMMERFDEMNTAHIELSQAMELALKAEETRDFSPTLAGNITVGLSSGTSGHRGLFVVAPKEKVLWLATILARFLPTLFRKERIALFLRANSNLYDSLNLLHIKFAFFDIKDDMQQLADRLQQFRPPLLWRLLPSY